MFLPCDNHTVIIPPVLSYFDNMWYNRQFQILSERITSLENATEGKGTPWNLKMIGALKNVKTTIKKAVKNQLNELCVNHLKKTLFDTVGKKVYKGDLDLIIKEVSKKLSEGPYCYDDSSVSKKIREHKSRLEEMSSQFLEVVYPTHFDQSTLYQSKMDALESWTHELVRLIKTAQYMQTVIATYKSVLEKTKETQTDDVNYKNDVGAAMDYLNSTSTSVPEFMDAALSASTSASMNSSSTSTPSSSNPPTSAFNSTSVSMDSAPAPAPAPTPTPAPTPMSADNESSNGVHQLRNEPISYDDIRNVRKNNMNALEDARRLHHNLMMKQTSVTLRTVGKKSYLEQEEEFEREVFMELREKLRDEDRKIYSYLIKCRRVVQ